MATAIISIRGAWSSTWYSKTSLSSENLTASSLWELTAASSRSCTSKSLFVTRYSIQCRDGQERYRADDADIDEALAGADHSFVW